MARTDLTEKQALLEVQVYRLLRMENLLYMKELLDGCTFEPRFALLWV